MAVYAISDTHFGHTNILHHRTQFQSIEEHDWFIVDRILGEIGKRDTLYILGDVVVYADALEYLGEIAANIDHLHVVVGNHDFERKGSPTSEDYASICKSVAALKRYKSAWLSHAPIHPAELRGKINIHGHVHSRTIDDSRYINVCCEAIDYKPINLADVLNTAA